MSESLQPSLQETVLAVLAFDDKYGGLIASQVVPEQFDGVYNEVASAVLTYRRRHNTAPGRAHLEDLFSRAKLDPSDRKTHALRRTLVNLSMLAEGVNAEYVTGRVQDFVRAQRLKTALLQANDRYLQGGDEAVSEVEGILSGALQFRSQTLDAGTFLNEVGKSAVFSTKENGARLLGIPELDQYGIGPTPKRMLLYVAPKNSGKSWFCVHVGRQCLIQKDRILHVSLEMGEQELLDRYFQSFFGIASRAGQFTKTILEFDDLERFVRFKARKVSPKLDFGDPKIQSILRGKVASWNTRFSRLNIKEFFTGSLTIRELKGYLDYLEMVHKFVPTILIVDYPDLFAISKQDYRLSLGRIFVELRGLGVERNMAVVVPTQAGRGSIGAKRVDSTNVTEDISKVFTADTVITYSQTEAELGRGLARLGVDHARNAPKGQRVLITQSYTTGQYVLQSTMLNNAYWEQMKVSDGEAGTEDV